MRRWVAFVLVAVSAGVVLALLAFSSDPDRARSAGSGHSAPVVAPAEPAPPGRENAGFAILVVDAESGTGIAGATAAEAESQGRFDAAVERRARVWTSDGSGRVGVAAPEPPRRLRVAAVGYRPEVVEVANAPERVELRRAGPESFEVVDEDGAPVPNARVHVLPADASPGAAPVDAVTTGSDGRFALVPGADESLLVLASGFAAAHVPATTRRVVLRRGFELKGTARGTDGEPVGGVQVTAEAEHDLRGDAEGLVREFHARSAPDGRFAIADVGFARYRLLASRPGFCLARAGAWAGDAGIVLTLARSCVVAGVVTTESGEPVGGVLLSIDEDHARSRPDGRFLFERVLPGEKRLTARHDSGAADVPLLLAEGESRSDVVVRLDPATRIPEETTVRVRVLDADGNPAPGMLVAVLPAHARPRDAVLSMDGEVLLDAATASDVRVAVPGSYEYGPVTDEAGWATVETDLPHGSRVRVRARPTIPQSTLEIDSEPTRLAGETETVFAPGAPVLVRLPRPQRVRFRLRGDAASVSVAGNARLLEARDESSEFVYDLEPGGRFHVVASTEEGCWSTAGWSPPANQETFDVPIERQPDPEPARGVDRVRGVVVDERGAPLSGALVTALVPDSDRDATLPATATRGDGSFDLRLPCPTPFVRVSKEGFGELRAFAREDAGTLRLARQGTLRVVVEAPGPWAPQEHRLELVLPLPGGSAHRVRKKIEGEGVVLRFLDADPAIPRLVPDWPWIPAPALAAPRAAGTIEGLGAGVVKVRLRSGGVATTTAEATIVPGESVEVVLRLPGG